MNKLCGGECRAVILRAAKSEKIDTNGGREEDRHEARVMHTVAAQPENRDTGKNEIPLLMDSWGRIHFPLSKAVSLVSVNTIQVIAMFHTGL